MGGSWSSNKRRHNYIQHPQPPSSTPPMILPPPPPPSNYASSSSITPPLHNYNYPPNPNPINYGYAPSHGTPQPNPNYSHPPPPPPLPAYSLYAAPAPAYHASGTYYGGASMYNQCGYVGPPVVNGVGYAQPYYVNQYNGWGAYRPAPPPHGFVMQQAAPQPKFVEHQNAKKVKNYVNVRKDSVKIQVDERHPDQFLVSFEFDAEHDGRYSHYFLSIT